MTPALVIPLPTPASALALAGPHETNLRLLAELTGAHSVLQGQELHVFGAPHQVTAYQALVTALADLWTEGTPLSATEIRASQTALAAHQQDALRHLQQQVITRTRRGEAIRAKTLGQGRYVQAIQQHEITFGIGPAGTGKTYLAAVLAVQALQGGQVERLILTRPAVEAGEKLGFLPGDLQQKVSPYLRPLYDALYDLMDPSRIPSLMERGVIEVAPLAYMRGRTLNNAFIILDEAQNTTPAQMKMMLTRLGFTSRMVITGDLTQTDLASHQMSGLAVAEQILQGVAGIAFCHLGTQDVVRHPLVQQIVTAYEAYERPTNPAQGN
ncbi:MAG: PhoH family protein [Gloeomargaritaceae cyanobacterium C42_A2020_066]|nr:PhoH family protein [Gloeomargaritaceae cyanobacterium C42_A2020_066]